MDSEARLQNGLLRSLSADDFEALRPHLRTVELTQSRVLAKVGEPITHVYLPHSGVISLVVELAQGDRIEVAMIGRDTILNLHGALAESVAVSNAIVLLPGVASMLDVDRLRAVVELRPALRPTLARHGMSLFVQAQQTAGCNAAHSVESRLARWLLRVRDLTGSDCFVLTQELIAEMIGARRNSVSIVAHTLQRANTIRYSRGHIEIIDLEGLTRTACECYAAVRTQYEGLLRPAGAKQTGDD
jgi:CRP-like cAMP-binding protein